MSGRGGQVRRAVLLLGSMFVRSFVGKVSIGSAVLGLMALALWLAGAQMGNVADWAAAVGSIFAAGVALSIATRDRRERRDEHADADRAQMRLVQIRVDVFDDSDLPFYVLRVTITNYGKLPILRARVLAASVYTFADVEGFPPKPSFTLEAPPGPDPMFIHIIPNHLESDARYHFLIAIASREADAEGIRMPWRPNDPAHPEHFHKNVNVEVEVQDSSGQTWVLSNDEFDDPDPYPGPSVATGVRTSMGQVSRVAAGAAKTTADSPLKISRRPNHNTDVRFDFGRRRREWLNGI